MPDIQLTGQGGSGNVEATGTISGTPVLAAPKTTQDSISSANGSGAKKGYGAGEMSPELMQALYILYNSGASGPQLVQLVMGTSGATDKIDPALFKLEVENKLNEICIGVLNAWAKSIAEQVRREREEEKSPAYQDFLARKGKAGYEAYLDNLPPLQRVEAITHEKHDLKVGRLDSTHNMLTSYVEHLRSNPSSNDNLPFMSSAITIGLVTQFDYAALPTSQASSIGINPVRDSSSSVLQSFGTATAELGGYLGGILAQAASLSAIGPTLILPANAKDEVVNHKFAQAFARNILTEVSGPGFSALAAGIYTSEAEKGGSLNQKDFTDLLKASLLSTAFSLLYATEPSVTENGTVWGRTMNGIDFNALAKGEVDLSNASEQMQGMYARMQSAINGLGVGKDHFIAAFAGFVDSNKDYDSWSQLKHIRGLLSPGDVGSPVVAV